VMIPKDESPSERGTIVLIRKIKPLRVIGVAINGGHLRK
jgi:hypothetical protein